MAYDPREHSADCDRCPLRGRVVVPPEGNVDAGMVIVGEGPGMNEVAHERPFIGPSGAKLVELLAKVGLRRADVWITNAVLCRAEVPGETGPRRYDVKLYLAWLRKENVRRKKEAKAARAMWHTAMVNENRRLAALAGVKLKKVDLYVPPPGFPPPPPEPDLLATPFECCFPRLRGELHRAERAAKAKGQPNGAVIMPMGNFAMGSVMGHPSHPQGILKWRGSVIPFDVQEL